MTILIVDDDPEDISLFCEAIHEIDSFFKCIAAKSGKEAIQMLSSLVKLPDYIFLDINMPGMNGYECLTEIKKNPKLEDIPVVMHSSTLNKEEINRSKELGAAEFLPKQEDYPKLVQALRKAFFKKPRNS
jgi:CheY-like chemotaxis protein